MYLNIYISFSYVLIFLLCLIFYVLLSKNLCFNQAISCHLGRLGKPHNLEDRGCHVGKAAIGDLRSFVVGNIDARHGVERVGGVGRAILVDSVVAVAMVGDYNHLITRSASCLHCRFHTYVDSLNSLNNSGINTSVSHHVAVSIIHHDEVILLLPYRCHEFVLYLGGAHLGLEVTGLNYKMVGTMIPLTNMENIYVLNTDGSAFVAGTTVNSFNAYFAPIGSQVPATTLTIKLTNGSLSGINEIISNESNNLQGPCYNINGQRVTRPAKGIHILNGKKVIF